MTLPRPFEGADRQAETKVRRVRAAEEQHATFQNPVPTPVNDDDNNLAGEARSSSFTKGLLHDEYGFVTHGDQGDSQFDRFTVEINRDDATDFSSVKPPIAQADYHTTFRGGDNDGQNPNWRGWESPRTGHYYDLQGADADAIGMAEAPSLGSSELVAEMAEVYAMSFVRDIPFSQFGETYADDDFTGLGPADALRLLNLIPHFETGVGANSIHTRRRLSARFYDPSDAGFDIDAPPINGKVTVDNLFRGSGPGAKKGPFVSQFMLIGNGGIGPATGGNADASPKDGYIAYGNQVIDQRVRTFMPGLDYMTNWFQWLDVQNGADMRGRHNLSPNRRFITTPRDLATYVRFDALYQAYLNACLILIGPSSTVSSQDGFPDRGGLARTPFASFGGPHILSLVTEVATRCLKAARRQKFNFHRRGRPERISGLLTLGQAVQESALNQPASYGNETRRRVEHMIAEFGEMLDFVAHHSAIREATNKNKRSFVSAPNEKWMRGRNNLLAMAFPEGSPMHPAYAAGHATVAGGCVTMLKAFFKTFDPATERPVPWTETSFPVVQSNVDGSALEDVADTGMTLEGELNKLAANISIGRNMAGVHYYSDYYDSLRMGERIAVSILIEQLYGYNEPVTMAFRSYDGDVLTLATDGTTVTTNIVSSMGSAVPYRTWWYRHMEAAAHAMPAKGEA
ncbi:hypothetical protein [Roseibium sp.]|uniref:hypothetical protein n=1 Tax=Roseibium sp. TaxID=1936156 RepID=UPI003B514CA1